MSKGDETIILEAGETSLKPGVLRCSNLVVESQSLISLVSLECQAPSSPLLGLVSPNATSTASWQEREQRLFTQQTDRREPRYTVSYEQNKHSTVSPSFHVDQTRYSHSLARVQIQTQSSRVEYQQRTLGRQKLAGFVSALLTRERQERTLSTS